MVKIFVFLKNLLEWSGSVIYAALGEKDMECLKVILSLKWTKRKEGIKINSVITSITPN